MNSNTNNNINFDPMTGQPIQNTNNQPNTNQQIINQSNIEQQINQQQIQTQLQNIPTVEQNHQQFINNVQTINQEKKEEPKEGINFVFIIVLFIIMLGAIYFLFPLLAKYI